MDLIDKMRDLATRIERQKDSVVTEEAAKTAFVLPFLQALGYDVFDPSEVVPELTADQGVKKGEKVDYAIKRDDKVIILIECKPIGSNLEEKHTGQLFRYFSVTEARFGVLTDGIRYLFFSDIEKETRMDDRCFFEFDVLSFTEGQVDELKKFMRDSFDLETIISSASNLKYHKAIVSELKKEADSPSEDFVRLFATKVYSGRITHQIKDQFTALVQKAFRDFIRERVNERLKSAFEPEKESSSEADSHNNEMGDSFDMDEDDSGIVTTEEEIEGFRIVQAIGAEIVDPERIVMRDAKSYCAILLDDNNRRTICRFRFGKSKKIISIFLPEHEFKSDLEKLTDIFKLKTELHEAIRQYK